MRYPHVRAGRLIATVVALASIAACGRGTSVQDAALKRDLDLVGGGQGLELAPLSGVRTTVSADELIPVGTRKTAPSARPTAVPRRATPKPEQAVADAPRASGAARDSVVAAAPATPRPSSSGAISPPPPGGYKTMGELIRKAPFPINP
jgi:hypothetical protein